MPIDLELEMLALMCFSVFGVIYAYAGYPALLYVLGSLKRTPEVSSDTSPGDLSANGDAHHLGV